MCSLFYCVTDLRRNFKDSCISRHILGNTCIYMHICRTFLDAYSICVIHVIVMIIYQLLIADPSLNSFRKDIVYPHAPLITHYRSFALLVVSQSHAGNRYQSSLIADKTQICQPIEIGIVLKIHYSSARTTWSWQSYFSIAGISIPKNIYTTLDLGLHIQRRCQTT